MRVVATAGHVDHGKSSLVLALTGTDPDRFPEEKARGLTIDLGFAFADLPSGETVGFVDVPGHVRFVKNMLAGVGAVDVVVLVVAATEGWMPQSEEHFRILELLGVREGLVVLTKVALVDEETLELAQLDVAEHLDGTVAADWPVVLVDSPTMRGIDDVRAALDTLLARVPPAPDQGRPRLWVDRAFAARGAGTVVTGTLVGGSLRIDDAVELAPRHRSARIRGIEAHHEKVDEIGPGSRVALNLAGVAHHDVQRGDAVVRAGQWADALVVDVEVTSIPGQRLPRRGVLAAHVGSGEHRVTWRALDEEGTYGRVRFSEALPLAPGDRIVLRSTGRRATVGGGVIADVAPPRRTRDALAQRGLSPAERALRVDGWLTTDTLLTRAGLTPAQVAGAVDALVTNGEAVRVDDRTIAQRTLLDTLASEAARRVAAHHAAQPSERGLPLSDLATVLAVTNEQARVVIAHAAGLVLDHDAVRDEQHRGSVLEDPDGRALLDALEAAPFAPPAPADLGTPPAVARALVKEGHAIDVDGTIFATTALDDARRLVSAALAERGALTVADIRDVLGSTRKYVLPIVAHLDRTGVTRRRGDERIAGPRAGTD